MRVTDGDVSMQHTCADGLTVTACIPTAACMANVERLNPTSFRLMRIYFVIPCISYNLVEKQKWVSNF